MNGLDYSAGTIPGALIKQSNYDFVIRYVDDPNVGLSPKHITPAEYRDLASAGVTVWLVFEIDVSDALGGFAAGQANARRARAGADWIGYPKDAPIFFCADMHLNPAQIPTALSYLDGAADVIGHPNVGAYGFWEFVDAAIAQGKASYFWQCGIAPATTDPVHLWQDNNTSVNVGGIQADVNHLLRPIVTGGNSVTAPATPALADWEQRRQFDRILSMSEGVEGQNFDGAQFKRERDWRTATDGKLAALLGALTTPQNSHVPGSSVQLSPLDAAMNADANSYQVLQLIASLQAKIDDLSAKLASLQPTKPPTPAPNPITVPAPAPTIDLDALAIRVAAHLAAHVSFVAK